MCSIAFHYAKVRALNFFIGREAKFALQTFAATTDTGAIARLTGIDDFVITRPALGATHSVEALISTPLVVASMLLSSFLAKTSNTERRTSNARIKEQRHR